MKQPNHQTLVIGSGVGIVAAAAAITAGILTRHHILMHRRKAKAMDFKTLEIDPKNPSNMEYVVSHNTWGF